MLVGARTNDVRSRGVHILQHDESCWTGFAVNSCLHKMARIGATAPLSDQRARQSDRFGRYMATVDEQIAEVKLGFLCHPKKLTGDRIARGESAASPAQKAATCCQLLPFCSRKTATLVSTVTILFLAVEGSDRAGRSTVPAQRRRGHDSSSRTD